jgi:hypothetical protein
MLPSVWKRSEIDPTKIGLNCYPKISRTSFL